MMLLWRCPDQDLCFLYSLLYLGLFSYLQHTDAQNLGIGFSSMPQPDPASEARGTG